MLDTSNKPIIAITGTETLIGAHVAAALARGEFPAWIGQVRGLMSEQSEYQPVRQWLTAQGVHPCPVSYNDPSAIEQQLRNVDFLLLVPPMMQQQPTQMIQETQRVIQAAKNAGVRNVIMLSYLGCDSRQNAQWLSAFNELERSVRDVFGPQHIVVRTSIPSQWFRIEAANVRDKGRLELPIRQSAQFTPIDLDDVARVIACIVKGQKDLDKPYRGQVLRLGGFQPVNGNHIVEVFTEALRAVEPRAPQLQWQETSRDKFSERLVNENRRMLQATKKPADACGASMNNEITWRACGPFVVTPAYAGLVADMYEVANDGKLSTNDHTDYKKLTGGWEPASFERFVRKYIAEYVRRQ